ncbi:MAG: hypothetical protein GEU99_10685 [Luteitalea sp.]|nr:hypothetical protein [Luteitalea sp.]
MQPYEFVSVPRAAIGILIAGSIAIAAIHPIRPLFAGREWLVGAAFGTVHGLAFSESLKELTLTPWVCALAVGGFNIGVEGAQLVAIGLCGAGALRQPMANLPCNPHLHHGVARRCSPVPGCSRQLLTVTASQAPACASMPAKQRLRMASPYPSQVST